MNLKTHSISHRLWDIFCFTSIVGIWPRFIEPKLIGTTSLNLPIHNLPSALNGFKILQFSDLHLNPEMSDHFLEKLIKKIDFLQPDLIVFTGDFLCYSRMIDPARLGALLKRFHAPYGCFAVLGNHDYDECVSINAKGEYDIIQPVSSSLGRAFSRLNETVHLTKTITERAKHVPMNKELLDLLEKTPFKLLHNASVTIHVNLETAVQDAKLNLTGLGEFMLGKFDAEAAFKNFDKNYPGIVLLHNPDGMPHLKNYPGDVVLCGHTHGGQVNLPWMWKKFTLLENMQFKKGLKKINGKWMYINRGIGSVLPFRWFSRPEILLLTLEQSQ